ncbi:hypothetical protein M5689_004856 [Euphorbia peplus]|nr:hypothetical protein M5689_004856 [Euphorbia peplus]
MDCEKRGAEEEELKKAFDKCLQDNNGDRAKCKSKFESLQSNGSTTKSSRSDVRRKPMTPLLRSGSISDV